MNPLANLLKLEKASNYMSNGFRTNFAATRVTDTENRSEIFMSFLVRGPISSLVM